MEFKFKRFDGEKRETRCPFPCDYYCTLITDATCEDCQTWAKGKLVKGMFGWRNACKCPTFKMICITEKKCEVCQSKN